MHNSRLKGFDSDSFLQKFRWGKGTCSNFLAMLFFYLHKWCSRREGTKVLIQIHSSKSFGGGALSNFLAMLFFYLHRWCNRREDSDQLRSYCNPPFEVAGLP